MIKFGTNTIHPTALIDQGVVFGERNYVGPFCIVKSGTKIGDDNHFDSNCVIGSRPEHKAHWHSDKNFGVEIGSKCVIRAFTTVDAGTIAPTILKDNVIMLRGSHVGHDAVIEDDVTLACNALIGGHTIVMQGANIGLGAAIHQNVIVGPYTMIGMNAAVTKKQEIWPLMVYVGAPAKPVKINFVKKSILTEEQIQSMSKKYFTLLERKEAQAKL